MDSINNLTSAYIRGHDFNRPDTNWPALDAQNVARLSHYIIDIFSSYGLVQVNKISTHKGVWLDLNFYLTLVLK